MSIVILENVRSAYNVWNVIRTADALGRDVRLVWYTPSPFDTPKVKKTSLWAEDHVEIKRFDTTKDMINYTKQQNIMLIVAEITEKAEDLKSFIELYNNNKNNKQLAVIFWNEVFGVDSQTLNSVDKVVYIPMQWIKDSLNIWQTTAIFMRALS